MGEIPARVNVLRAVAAMRERRPGMIQTKEQYVFAYLSVLEWTEQLLFDRGLLGEENGEENGENAVENEELGENDEYDEAEAYEDDEVDQYV